nr:DNA-directed RNA polymerase subunit beta [Paenibacillus hunanensis]
MLVLVGFAAALVIGMTVGYSVLGHHSIADVLYPETWAHVFQLVYAP